VLEPPPSKPWSEDCIEPAMRDGLPVPYGVSLTVRLRLEAGALTLPTSPL
jgi:hypothetical protein